MAKKDLFFCAAREHGQERPDLPLWGLRPEVSPETAFPLHSSMPSVRLQEVKGLKGGFQILDLMNADECEAFVDVLETLGFHTDAATWPRSACLFQVSLSCFLSWALRDETRFSLELNAEEVEGPCASFVMSKLKEIAGYDDFIAAEAAPVDGLPLFTEHTALVIVDMQRDRRVYVQNILA
eukprot:g12974.t1